MSKGEKKLVYNLLIIIIIFSGILIYKVNEKQYDIVLYNEIASEYDKAISEEEENDANISNNTQKESVCVVVNAQGKKYRIVGRIQIAKINVNYPIISETTEEYLKIAPTKLYGPNINEIGNFCIIGHNYWSDVLFSRLSQLEKGDHIILTDNDKKSVKYSVFDSYVVDEKDVSCINQNTNGKREVTLITCTNNRNKRLVVRCSAIGDVS